jgi:hypothetical protein
VPVLLRKAEPGSDSYGHVWRTARSVVEVTDEQAADLLKIADAGFAVVEHQDDEDDDGERQVTEVPAVKASADATGTTRPARRRRGADVQE